MERLVDPIVRCAMFPRGADRVGLSSIPHVLDFWGLSWIWDQSTLSKADAKSISRFLLVLEWLYLLDPRSSSPSRIAIGTTNLPPLRHDVRACLLHSLQSISNLTLPGLTSHRLSFFFCSTSTGYLWLRGSLCCPSSLLLPPREVDRRLKD